LDVRLARKQTFDQPLRFREHRIRSEIARRRAIAFDVWYPRFSAFLMRFAAPVEAPPCIRHPPLFIEGD